MRLIALKALLSGAWGFLRAIPLIVYVGLLALVFALASGHYRHQRDVARQDYAQHLKADDAALAGAKAQAKAAEQKQAAVMAAAEARWAGDKADAVEKQARVIDDLRNGAIRLQKRWRGCQPVPSPAAGTQGSDDSADDRSQSAGRIVRFAAESDAQVTYLQGLIRSAPACFTVE